MAVDVFSVPIFLVIFRETLETVIIVAVLLAFLKQTLGSVNSEEKHAYKALRRQVCWRVLLFGLKDTDNLQVWLGTGVGFLVTAVLAGVFIGIWYSYGNNSWEMNENYYEGAFCLLASVIISVMGVTLLRIGKLQEKWRLKLASALEKPIHKKSSGTGRVKRFFEKYAMFTLPFITVLREGVEAIVFVSGVSFSAPASSVPLAVIVGLAVGCIAGYALYRYIFLTRSIWASFSHFLQGRHRNISADLPDPVDMSSLSRGRGTLLPCRLAL